MHVVSSDGVLAIITCAVYSARSNPSTTSLSPPSVAPAGKRDDDPSIDKESLQSLICMSEYLNSVPMMSLIYLLRLFYLRDY